TRTGRLSDRFLFMASWGQGPAERSILRRSSADLKPPSARSTRSRSSLVTTNSVLVHLFRSPTSILLQCCHISVNQMPAKAQLIGGGGSNAGFRKSAGGRHCWRPNPCFQFATSDDLFWQIAASGFRGMTNVLRKLTFGGNDPQAG